MKHWLLKHKVICIYVIAIIFFQTSFLRNGSPFRFDWSWPLLSLGDFWRNLFSFADSGLMGFFIKNVNILFGLMKFIPVSSSILLLLTMCLLNFVAAYSFYKFVNKKTKTEIIAIIAGLVYAFSPYIFIRTITGFMWSMLAYSLVPLLLLLFYNKANHKWRYPFLGTMLSFIFAQIQAGLLVSLVLFVGLIISLFFRNFKTYLKTYFFAYLFFLIFNLPWFILYFLTKKPGISGIANGSSVTTLGFMTSLPHSFRNIFMLSDHHITAGFFYPLAHDKLFSAGWLIVWLVALCAIFNKKNRELVLTFIISCLIVLPFIKGPLGVFGKFYIWFYNHFPQIAVFRETYHFEFLYAVSLCVLFAFGLDWLWGKISNLKSEALRPKSQDLIRIGLKSLFAGSAIFIIAPYLTFDYAGYLKLQKIPQEYYQLNNFFKTNKDYCHKMYYPPGLGFIYFKNDKTAGASNSDTLASSVGVPYLADGTSVLNLPSDEMFYRNELVSQFYEKKDTGEFASLLNEGGVDCVVLRLDTETKYDQASNLWKEKDSAVRKKWNQTDLLSLIKSKEGLGEVKTFGEDIHIFKISNCSNSSNCSNQATNPNNTILKTGEPAIQRFSNKTISELPLTDWANNYAYYKDGWSRGRYDFWRKHLFTQLRQDFIYTDKPESLLTGKVDQEGDYEVWARYLTGGTPGEIELRIKNYELRVQKEQGDEKFIWKKIGDIRLDGKTEVEIKNISGENAVADLVLIKR